MIIQKGEAWTVIKCESCGDCHKVLTDKFQSELICPYCTNIITLVAEDD